MDGFSAPIVQQPRLLMVVPVVIIGLAIVAGNIAWWLAGRLGAPRVVSLCAGLVFFIGGIALALLSGRGSQGMVRVRSGELELDGRWGRARHIPLAGAQLTPAVWRRGAPAGLLVGAIVEVRSGSGKVAIGATDPSLAEPLAERGAATTTIPPDATLAPTQFRQLMQVLGEEVQAR